MNYEDQLEYIDQLIKRFRYDLYDRAMIDDSKKNWELISSYNSADSENRCDFIHQNGNRCNRPIKKIFVAKNITTKEIIKIGSTCLKKLLGIPKKSKFKADEFYSQNEELNKKEETLKSSLEESAKLASTDGKEIRTFSDQEKELIIERARQLTILPSSMESLLSAEIPLSSNEYYYLYRNIKRLVKERKEKERIEGEKFEAKRQKEKGIKEEVYRKSQVKKMIEQNENKLKEVQEDKRFLLYKSSLDFNKTPYLFGKKGSTDIDIVMDNSLIRVFVESGVHKENIKSNEDDLLFLAKKVCIYYCESKCSYQDTSNISLALIMRAIRKYYDLNSSEQIILQKKIKEQIYTYFENELSKKYNLSFIYNGDFGFEYCFK